MVVSFYKKNGLVFTICVLDGGQKQLCTVDNGGVRMGGSVAVAVIVSDTGHGTHDCDT